MKFDGRDKIMIHRENSSLFPAKSRAKKRDGYSAPLAPESASPGLSASCGAASSPLSKCSQIRCRSCSRASGDSILKHGWREDFVALELFLSSATWTCCPEEPMSNLVFHVSKKSCKKMIFSSRFQAFLPG